MKKPIFLSASVPTREPFVSDFDTVAIREAVLALVATVVRERKLVFGGHPAISPLVEHAARSLGAVENVHIYQSQHFEKMIPLVARKFENLHWTKAVTGTDSDLLRSLTEMRLEMITKWDFSAAVIIGGMEGIFEEVELFKHHHPKAPIIAVGSTGGAAKKVLADEGYPWNERFISDLTTERRYRQLFRALLPKD